ncbi:hypothetical protein CL622_00580 [archaeon]|nr:hypothetical protein [archaeon]|tara:strand:+ start:1981 stop:2712 length:732 start_codon:yes stop_codon:yes gene_type:complete
MDTTILEDLGLTKAEIKTYTTLLELGDATAGPVLKHSHLQSSVIHRCLNSLIEKGLISFIQEGKKRIYKATNPENFYSFIDDKKKRFTELLPELKQKQANAKETHVATIYKGKKGISEIYTQILNTKGKEYNTFGGGRKVTYDIMGKTWWKNLHTKRIARKIRSRQIFDESIRAFGNELNKRPYSQVKFLSQDFAQLTETVIRGDTVGIIIFTEHPYGLIIKDLTVAESYQKNFELLWKKATT